MCAFELRIPVVQGGENVNATAAKRGLILTLAVIQWLVPVSLGWQNAMAQSPVQAASEGQAHLTAPAAATQSSLGWLRSTVTNSVIQDDNTTIGTQTGDPAPTGQTVFNLRDIGFTSSITDLQNTLENYRENPDQLPDAGRSARRNNQGVGCRTTNFSRIATNNRILRVTPYLRILSELPDGTILTSDVVDTQFSGEIPINFGALGNRSTFDRQYRAATLEAPGKFLRYEHTPFAVPNDGSYFGFHHRVAGALTGTQAVVDYGNKANNWTPTIQNMASTRPQGAMVTASGTIEVSADLYRVDRTYTMPPPGAICPYDPPTNVCEINGVYYCARPGRGVLDLFALSPENSVAAATTVSMQSFANPYDENNADVKTVTNNAQHALAGTSGDFTQLFTQCRETSLSTMTTRTEHREEIRGCAMIRSNLNTSCSGQRNLQFARLQRSTVLEIEIFNRVKTQIIDPITRLPTGAYTYQDVPATYSGNINISYPMIGSGGVHEDPPPGNEGIFFRYTKTPFTVSPSVHFPYNVEMFVDGTVTPNIASYGDKDNSWMLSATASVTNTQRLRVDADLYTIPVNTTGCEDYARLAADGFCTANMTCTDMRGPCATVNGVTFCEGSGVTAGIAGLLADWMYQGEIPHDGTITPMVPKMCWAATGAQMDCSRAYFGQLDSWVDTQGVTHNFESSPTDISAMSNSFGETGWVDNCALTNLHGNSQCRLLSNSTCTEGAQGTVSGTCYVRTALYDCGEDYQISTPGGTGYSNLCTGAIRCMGTECHNPAAETNTDFSNALTSAQIADWGGQDMQCAETGAPPAADDPAQHCTPLIFGGSAEQCKIPIGSGIGLTPDCCEQGDEAAANAPGWMETLLLAWRLYSLSTDRVLAATASYYGLGGLAEGIGNLQGMAAGLREGLTSPIRSMGEKFGVEIFSTSIATESAQLQMINLGWSQGALEGLYSGLNNMGMSDLANQLMGITGDGLYELTELGQQAAGALNVVMQAWNVYSIARLIGHIIFQCTTDELQLGIKKKQRLCHYVGTYCSRKIRFIGCIEERKSYCCYKTALSRIIMEQIRGTQGLYGGFGSASSPRCGGLTPTEIAAADWSRIDLSEWTDMLQEAGLLPDSTTSAQTMWGLSSSRTAIRYGAPASNERTPVEQIQARITPETHATLTASSNALRPQAWCYSDPELSPFYVASEPEQTPLSIGFNEGANLPEFSSRTFTQEIDIPRGDVSARLAVFQADNYGQLWVNDTLVFQGPWTAASYGAGGRDLRGTQITHDPGQMTLRESDGTPIQPFTLTYGICNNECSGMTPNLDISSAFRRGRNTVTLVCINHGSIGPCKADILGTVTPPVFDPETGCINPDGTGAY